MSDERHDIGLTRRRAWPWVLSRLLAFLGILLAVGLGLYALQAILSPAFTISYSVLFVLPFFLGAMTRFLRDPNGRDERGDYFFDSIWIIAVLGLGGIFLREGIMCIIMLAPLWVPSAMLGAYTTRHLQQKFKERYSVSVSVLVLPLIIGIWGDSSSYETGQYEVSRSIVVDAPVAEVWPLLSEMQDIEAREGSWNITQDILGVPRPTSAVVAGAGVGAVSNAQWQGGISFEEHILTWDKNRAMRWEFVFPNDSVQRHTDRHISPDGRHLKILEGGYKLYPLAPNRTRVVLDTQYQAATPVNRYAALWGELFLGNIQTNILNIIKSRAEVSS